MPLAAELLDAYRSSAYRVRLPSGGVAEIRIGALVPEALLALLCDRAEPWGFVTAWNPGSRPAARLANRAAQRALLAQLRPVVRLVRSGVGIGRDGWREPSLWVAGIPHETLHALARRFGQLALVCGGEVAALAVVGGDPGGRRRAAAPTQIRSGTRRRRR
jgi:hypothetical protein